MKTVPLLAALGIAAVCGLTSRGDPVDDDKLGVVHFNVSGTKAAQAEVIRGVKLVHHMMYVEADRAFAAAVAADPKCALGYWGRAMAIVHPLWPDMPSETERKAGAEYIQRGLACPPQTPRERAYLQTMDQYFNPKVAGDHVARLKLLDEAFTALAEAYPDDLDAVAYSALYHLAPARFLPKDKSHRIQLESVARLQKVLSKLPSHPGAQHYKIHAYDFPLLADRALEVCDTYTGIAPDVPHALHMPTHIFTRRGLWDKSIEYNRRSAEAARKLGEVGGTNGHLAHALDYLAYAYLQRGQYREAAELRRQVLAFAGPYAAAQRTTMAFAFAAIPARYALERQEWREAAQLSLHQPASFAWGSDFRNCEAIIHFARGLGAARSGQRDAAQTEIAALERIQGELARTKGPTYWRAQAETQALTIRAWLAWNENNAGEAVALMRRAAEIEATTDKEAVTPGEVLPAGELLGELLLAASRASEALTAFEGVLAASPNRLNTLHGAARAAEAAGETAKARSYYEQVLAVAVDGDPDLAQTRAARAYLAKSGGGRAE